MKNGLDGLAGALDVTQVGDLVLRQWSRDADDEDVTPAEVFGIRCREVGMPEASGELLVRDVQDV